MNRFRLIAIWMTLMFAMTAIAQPAAAQEGSPAGNPHHQSDMGNSASTVENHLKFLSEKLDLSADQQAKAKPVLQEMQDAIQNITQNKKLSDQERTSKMRACHLRADTRLRAILNDDQKQKLDQLEQDAHMDLHGNGSGAASR